jgi:beta-fructofuranosidase
VRAWIQRPLRRGFWGSVPRDAVRERQERHGVKAAAGAGWIHLGWIADPERERYAIERRRGGGWEPCGRARFGSFLWRGEGGAFRVRALPRGGGEARILAEVRAEPEPGEPPLCAPVIAGPWRTLFRPRRHGRYVNDHTVFRDASGRWRLLGITSATDGDFDAERWFASGVSETFPPPEPMAEEAPVADFGELAWAPHVVATGGRWHLFWSPHRLHQMSSPDGVRWEAHRITLDPPFHRFFRDAMVLEVAPGQWLLYATARGRYRSRVDLYQSFDLEGWQYIGAALRTGFGSERNSPFASTESPTVVRHAGRFYLALTYNNDSFFWPGLLLLRKRWLGRASYNDTRVFHAPSPYDFGVYRGARRAPTQVARLEAHAAELVRHPETGQWWITTAGWPWVATLTAGEVAVAPLRWERVSDPARQG